MRRRGARESRKKKNQIKAGGMGRKVTCLPFPFPSVLINVFSYYYSFFAKKKNKKTILAYRYTARNNQIATFGYVSGTNQITALRYACANQSIRVSSFMPIMS